MIARDFDYILPDTKEEAVQAFSEYEDAFYYGGGSEIITMCRADAIAPAAVIDLKKIPELSELKIEGDALVIGGCATLRAIKDSNLFPLLGAVCGRIADHTNQCRITLGGNLCSTIIYRETSQVLMLTDADVEIFGRNGLRTESIHAIFDGRMRLERGEFVLKVRIPERFLDAPTFHIKKTSSEKIDYPLISVSAICCEEGLRFAVSGLLDHPFRLVDLEDAFNDKNIGGDQRLENVMSRLPETVINDYQGSADYRRFVFKRTLAAIMEELKD